MKPEQVRIVRDRLQSVIDAVRLQQSGCDVHTVGNIRNTAAMLQQQLDEDPGCMDDDLIYQITKNVENSVVDFYKKKYESLHKEKPVG